uniref:THH1/TOM1/TOM3 domain-containing protein n=1 Tax=Aegilops tauschii subsp. strangulata TaxID=200361 RepID=A0A453ARV9_AEGTS
ALIYLGFAVAWVMAAATAAEVVARRAWGEGSAPVLFLHAVMYGALKVCVYTILAVFALVVLLLCTQCVAYVIALVSGSTSGFKKVSCKLTHSDLYSDRIAAVHRPGLSLCSNCSCTYTPRYHYVLIK